MTKQEYEEISAILNSDKPFLVRPLLIKFLERAEILEETPKKRTGAQNNAMHLYFETLATELNAAGYDMKKVLKQEVDIEWSKEMVKRYLWKPIQEALYATDSTTDLDKQQVSRVYEHLNRLIAEKCGIHVPFPHEYKNTRLTAMENLSRSDYPEYTGEVKF